MATLNRIPPHLGLSPLARGPSNMDSMAALIAEMRARSGSTGQSYANIAKAAAKAAAGYGGIFGGGSALPEAPLADYPDISSGLIEGMNSALAGPTAQNAFAQAPGEYLGSTVGGTGAIDAGLSGAGVTGEAAELGAGGEALSTAPAAAETAVPGAFDFAGVGTAGNAILPVAGALGAADLIHEQPGGKRGALQGAASGAAIGSYAGPVGAVIGAGLGAIGGGLMQKSGKDADQLARDAVRETLENAGVTKDYKLDSGGNKFDIGKDGSTKAYNVDFSKKDAGTVVGLLAPAGLIVSKGNQKLNSDFTGYFTNAALNGGDTMQNVRNIYAKLGISKDMATAKINAAQIGGQITKEQAASYLNGVNIVFGDSKILPEPTTGGQGQ